MKNIHVLPTDKPSRIYFDVVTKELLLQNRINSNPTSFPIETRNIYITSDEEIKEGDWVYSIYGFIVQVDFLSDGYLHHVNGGNNRIDCYKKIIITTDQELIKDGVQSIDDEFLEWFVENPSCESVKVVYEPKNFLDIRQGYEYVIIIPKEEPSKEFIKDNFDLFINILSEPKQETIEEVAERLVKAHPDFEAEGLSDYQNGRLNGIIEGIEYAQQQDKKLYSEEDLKEAFAMGRTNATIKDFNTKFKNK